MALALLIFFVIGISGINACQGPWSGPFAALEAGTPTPTPVPCKKPRHATGDSSVVIPSAGMRRFFLLHLPPSYGQYLQPLIIGYHGYSWTAQMMEQITHLNGDGDRDGFILAYPQGVDSPPSWNAGVGAYGPTGDGDDVQFTRDLIGYLENNYCVDAHRVYLTGFSLGGGIAYRAACVLSEQITAVATVSGAYYPFGGCHPARPLPVLEIHGAADTQAPYNGNPALHMAAVRDYLNVWLAQDKCSATSRVFFQTRDVTGTEWTNCADGTQVVHYRIADGGHSWPRVQVMNANAVILQFFNRFSR